MKNRNYWCFPATERAEKKLSIKIDDLLKRICSEYEISLKEIKGKRSLKHIVEPRKIAMFILHKEYKVTQIETGKMFNRGHPTVIHACKSIAGFMEFDKEFRNKVNNLI